MSSRNNRPEFTRLSFVTEHVCMIKLTMLSNMDSIGKVAKFIILTGIFSTSKILNLY